jgi:hypothetical protein
MVRARGEDPTPPDLPVMRARLAKKERRSLLDLRDTFSSMHLCSSAFICGFKILWMPGRQVFGCGFAAL